MRKPVMLNREIENKNLVSHKALAVGSEHADTGGCCFAIDRIGVF